MNSPGEIDLTFGTQGKVTTEFGGVETVAVSAVIQPNGYIILGGHDGGGSAFEWALARYTPLGALDTTFGTGGKVTYSFGANKLCGIKSLKLQSDGKIVAGGFAETSSVNQYAFAIVRFNVDGTVDSTFGTGGQVVETMDPVPDPQADDFGGSLVIYQDVGTIVLGGTTQNGVLSPKRWGLLSVDKDGVVNYKKLYNFTGTSSDTLNSLSLNRLSPQGDFMIAGGYSAEGFNESLALARFGANGEPDTSFGTGGKVTTSIAGTTQARGNSVAIRSNGQILLGGYARFGTFPDQYDNFVLAQYNTDGSLDTDFGDNGLVITGIISETSNDQAYSVAVQDNGKIILAGWVEIGLADFSMYRFNKDGDIDTTFGTNGRVTTDFGATNDKAYSAVIQSDGDIILAGFKYPNGGGPGAAMALARYHGDPIIPTPTPTPADTTKNWISSLGGGIHGFIPKAVITTNNNYGYVRTRTIVRNQWSKQYLSAPKKVAQTPFRAINNAGDLLSRQDYSCGGPTQSFQSRPGISGLKGSLGHVNRNCGEGATDTTEAAACNSKFVYDTSDYIRYRKQRAINKNYNDKSNGGNDSSGAQVAIRASRRFF